MKAKNIDDLVRDIAEDTGATLVLTREFFRSLISNTDKYLRSGTPVIITGLVKITPVIRKTRRAHNVVKKKIVQLPESVGVSVTAGKVVKDAIATLTVKDIVD